MAGLPPTLEEFYRHGPGPEVWAPLRRKLAVIDVAANTIKLESHGASPDDEFELIPVPDVEGLAELPAGLSANTTYYAIVVSPSELRIAATAGGAPIDFSGTADFNVEVEFDIEPALTQALSWGASRFLACAAKNGWVEPAGGWQGDVKDVVCDLVAYPQLDRRGYKADGKDGYRIRWEAAREDIKAFCNGILIPDGIVPPGSGVDPGASSQGFGSSGWGEDPVGYLGQTLAEPRRRRVVS